jgi:hypothetical protein
MGRKTEDRASPDNKTAKKQGKKNALEEKAAASPSHNLKKAAAWSPSVNRELVPSRTAEHRPFPALQSRTAVGKPAEPAAGATWPPNHPKKKDG